MDSEVTLAVQQALVRYAFALDQHDAAGLESVLTEDAAWQFTITGAGEMGPVAGRSAILGFVKENWATQTGPTRHNLTNVIVDRADATTAEAQAYLLMTSAAGPITTGSYRFTLRRDENSWRIVNLDLVMDSGPA